MSKGFVEYVVEMYIKHRLRKAKRQFQSGNFDNLNNTLRIICNLVMKHIAKRSCYVHTMSLKGEAKALHALRWITKQQHESIHAEAYALAQGILQGRSGEEVYWDLTEPEKIYIADMYTGDTEIATLAEEDRAQVVAGKTLVTPDVVLQVVEYMARVDNEIAASKKYTFGRKRALAGDTARQQALATNDPGIPKGFFGIEARPPEDGRCSDNACPCAEVLIPRGGGYLYIPEEIVAFRTKHPEREAAFAVASGPLQGMAGRHFVRIGPVLVCEEGAKLRNLDLDIAAEDARRWWDTGLVPLRATPLAGEK